MPRCRAISSMRRFSTSLAITAFCRACADPYRAKTKGKVERMNRYLRYSFHLPLVSRLGRSGLELDVATRRPLRLGAAARAHL
jgi:transposase